MDTRAELKDGTRFDGLDGLKDYLKTRRQDEFLRNFCRKLLGYALGRAVQLSDEPLIDEMLAAAAGERLPLLRRARDDRPQQAIPISSRAAGDSSRARETRREES